jgi:hypothetical protein
MRAAALGPALRAEAPAVRQAVLSGKHEVQHEQVVALARELLVHAHAVGHRLHFVAFAAEVLHEQVAQALVVVHDEDPGLELGHGAGD